MVAQIVIRDGLGRKVVLGSPPQRIVSLVPSITETIIELGARGRLVGITNYCIHPAPLVRGIAKVGGTKGFSPEKIDELRPDLVIANKEENRRHQIERLREKYDVFVTYPRDVDQAIQMVADLAVITGTGPVADEFSQSCGRLLGEIDQAGTSTPHHTACMIWRDPWMAAGPDSYMSALLERTGFANVFAGTSERYPETTIEAVIDKNVDVIMLPSEPYEFGGKDRAEVQALVRKRGRRTRVLLVEGSYLTWFGSRTLPGLRYLWDVKKSLPDVHA